ncbi:MAG: hypothetical protein D6760_06340 [Deltaproteobacteria bacterium]|nr:MAG: hypothetical protein D6760_06340 [Deltaproteobacteria bacterium]
MDHLLRSVTGPGKGEQVKSESRCLDRAGRQRTAARRFWLSSFALVTSLVLAAGCASSRYARVTAPSQDESAQQLQAFNESLALMAARSDGAGDYRIGPEDLLEVTLFDIEDATGDPRMIPTRVSNSGYVTLPYVGKIKAQGLTPLELEDTLRTAFQQFIHDPQITVFVREYRSYRVSVVGYVNQPGVLELKGRKTLLEALAMAGGVDDDAGREIRLSRQTAGQVQTILIDLDRLAREGDMSLNLALLPGDVINVPRAGTFFVEGEVNKPGAYPLIEKTTVTQALATAGGPDFKLAKLGGITLFRKQENGERVAIAVDLDAIRSGKADDFLVNEDDVILVPLSGAKYFVDRVMGRLGFGFTTPL